VKRSLVIRFKDGVMKEVPLSRGTKIKASDLELIHFDQLPDKTWRLTYTDSAKDRDFSEVQSFTIHRED